MPLTKTCPTCCLSLEVAKSHTTSCFNYKFCRPPAGPFLCMCTGAGLRLSNLSPNLFLMKIQPGSSSSVLALGISLLISPSMHPQSQWEQAQGALLRGSQQPGVCSASGLLGKIPPGHPSPSGQGSLRQAVSRPTL